MLCNPIYLLLALCLMMFVILALPKIWQTITGSEAASKYDWNKMVLIGLALIALLSLALFLAVIFGDNGTAILSGC